MQKILKGSVLIDKEDGEERVVLHVPEGEYEKDDYNFQLTGYQCACVCESWYSEEELRDRFNITEEVREINKLPSDMIDCECEIETEDVFN